MSSELRFEKKVAIVTGGCQGIGKGCSEILDPGDVEIDHISVQDFRDILELNVVSHFTMYKGAIPALAKALAIDEAKNGVRINTTPLYEDWLAKLKNPEDGERVKAWTQLGRIGDPREIGKACLFLATDATFTTGTELMCTGGCEIGYGVKD
ncbi:DHB14-like protein [Mya arenaria]|uniref:DHB14-like protein n=1 Tax=Mya arenaria TaxID=6604 RepID=A0ABY7G8I8_MYAAR|nr:DHB14-like protein [Mya arenaria]